MSNTMSAKRADARLTTEARFAVRLRRLRGERGLSAQQLAEQTGMTRAAISKIECGRRNVSLGEAIDLADGLGVPLMDMCSPEPIRFSIEIEVA